MRLKDAKKVVAEVYKIACSAKYTVPWKRGLRPSGFPYCGLKDLFDLQQGGKIIEAGFTLDYYGGVGTAAHRVFQKYMGLTGLVVGNWKCSCGNTTKWSTNNICSCGLPMEYEEVFVSNGSIRGFIDCILFIAGKYYVLDYKTSSVKKLTDHRLLGNVYPIPANKSQVLSYCANLERQNNITIEGWMLIYIARDNPNDFVIECGEFNSTNRISQKQLMIRYNRHYSIAGRINKEGVSIDDPDLHELIKNKCCSSYEEYKEIFGPYGDCLLGNSQVCFHKKRLLRILKESNEDR